MWIQARREPKKKWLEMYYCITIEEVQWVIWVWPDQWKVPVASKKGTKGKEQEGTRQSSSPTTNTWKVSE